MLAALLPLALLVHPTAAAIPSVNPIPIDSTSCYDWPSSMILTRHGLVKCQVKEVTSWVNSIDVEKLDTTAPCGLIDHSPSVLQYRGEPTAHVYEFLSA